MEIQCPSCQKKLSIGDHFGGQLVKCPACNGVFMAPSLAATATPIASPVANSAAPAVAPTVAMPMATPVRAQAQGSAPDVIPFSSEPRPPSPYTPPPPPPAPPPPPVLFEADDPPGPPSEFGTAHTIRLDPEILRWIAPAALAIVFVLSFFRWVVSVLQVTPVEVAHPTLWEIAFGDRGSAAWIFYVLLTLFLALPLAWAKLLMEMNPVPTLDFLKPFWMWRAAAIGGIVAVALTFATLGWLRQSATDASAIGIEIGLRAHLIALIACGLEFWLAHRKKKRLPLPELTVRW